MGQPDRWLDTMKEAIEYAMQHPGPHGEELEPKGGAGRFFGDLELAGRLPAFAMFAKYSPAAWAAQALMKRYTTIHKC